MFYVKRRRKGREGKGGEKGVGWRLYHSNKVRG